MASGVVPGEQPHQGRDWPGVLESGAGKSDLHLAAELGGKYKALGPKKGSKKSGLGGGCRWPRMRPSGFVDRGGSESSPGERHVRDSAG